MDKAVVLLDCFRPSLHEPRHLPSSPVISSTSPLSSSPTRRALSLSIISLSTVLSIPTLSRPAAAAAIADFSDLPDSGGVKALDLRIGSGSVVPDEGDQVAIHYYGRLAAKQGWRFDSTYDHKDSTGEPVPFVFTLGSGKVIAGIENSCEINESWRGSSSHHSTFTGLPEYDSRTFTSQCRGCLLPFSIQHVLPMEKAQHWELLYSTMSLSA
ncbi:PEPTIDYL-PROLYL CIS-TRANS ISOMERASE FKBP17-1 CHLOROPLASTIC [Salix purpurea]|uniref:peptidylprolyl isomerase n=1 Tax=Salix purpurea TaxID=77065 RepID=A0A9Q0ZVL7_SALPP|nr:PEPTIDYL-PROLYL CIS-TRANS ISOMERASE FKBP17-1 CHLOROPLASTIC [Salix purpurea]